MVPLMFALLGSWDRFVCRTPVGASRCLPGSVALLFVLGWALLVLSCCSPFVWLLSLSFVAFPPPSGLSCLVPWSSSYLGLLVPPSGYLVAAVTA